MELDTGISYHWNLSAKRTATVEIDANYRGGIFYYVQGDPRQFEPGYLLVNPRFTLGGPGDVWKLSIWAKNVTNKQYFSEIFNDGG